MTTKVRVATGKELSKCGKDIFCWSKSTVTLCESKILIRFWRCEYKCEF